MNARRLSYVQGCVGALPGHWEASIGTHFKGGMAGPLEVAVATLIKP